VPATTNRQTEDREPTTRPVGAYVARTLTTLVIPQGYTLSIAGSFAIAVQRYSFATLSTTIAFVTGAVVAFVLLGFIASDHLRQPADLQIGLRALVNIVPLITVAIVAGVLELVASTSAGFIVAGFLAAGTYIALVSVLLKVTGRAG
jgi:hypothetical protein